MSHSPTAQPESTESVPAPTHTLRCPICGGVVVTSLWVADTLICETGCYWSGPASACKPAGEENEDSSTMRKREELN